MALEGGHCPHFKLVGGGGTRGCPPASATYGSGAGGHTICNLMLYIYALTYCLICGPTSNSVGDYVEDTILQDVVYQFQSEGGVYIHPLPMDL